MANQAHIMFGNREDLGQPDPLRRAVQITVGGGRPALSAMRAASMIRDFLGCSTVEIWARRSEHIWVQLSGEEMCCPFLQGNQFVYSATYDDPLR